MCEKVMKLVRHSLAVMMVCSFLFFILGEVLFEPENSFDNDTVSAFEADWFKVDEDGTEEAIEVPGQYKTTMGEWLTITTILPDSQDDVWLCIRSLQQDVNIYVGEELRKGYSTLETQPFGKTSTMTYVMFPLYEEDAGESLTISLMSKSSYSGVVGEIIEGERFDILQHFYSLYIPSAIIAVILLLIGVFVIGISTFLWLGYKKKADIFYLGGAMVIAASWLLVESKIRQFVFPNSTIAMLTGFLLIAILPYPILSYINSIQRNRYRGIYMAIGICTAVNYVFVVTLQVLNIKDFFETMTLSHIIIIVLIITMTVTIILDIINGHIVEYKEVAFGFAVLMIAGVGEIALVYAVSAQLNGVALSIGLILLLFSAGLKTVRDLVTIEKEKQYAMATSESKAKFLANMSHEIRTPINTMLGMNEMILRENHDDTIEEYAENIKSAGHMLLGLINDVLDYSKIEAGKFRIIENEYLLAVLLRDTALGSEMSAQRKNLAFKTEIDESMPSVLVGDDVRIKQVLNNLLSNAVKYTQEGSIVFSARSYYAEEQFYLELSVKDTGIGIRKEDMDKLFGSFQRLEMSKNRYIEGTGLGLNITRILVELMNGTISVESEYGVGSCFVVRLPQKIVNKEPIGDINAKKTVVKAPTSVLHIPDKKILVVDDTRINLKVIQGLLKRTSAQLDLAGGGNECLEKSRQTVYDIILMDHMMPEPDGVETLHLIRAEENNPNRNTPIIVMTANAIEGMEEEYKAEGFSDYISKPVDPEKLEALLAKYVN